MIRAIALAKNSLKMFFFVMLTVSPFVPSANANVLGNYQTFQPSPDLTGFLSVHSSQGLSPQRYHLAAYGSYMRNELTVFDSLTPATARYVEYRDHAMQFDFTGAWQVFESLQVTAAMTGILYQSADEGQIIGGIEREYYVTDGGHSFRPGVKYSLRQGPLGWGAALVGSVDFPISLDDPYTGDVKRMIMNIEAVVDWFNDTIGLGANIGYRHRRPGDTVTGAFTFPLESQLTYSGAFAYKFTPQLTGHFELIGVMPMADSNYPGKEFESSLEALIGAGWKFNDNFQAKIGGTIEVQDKGLSPDYRVLAGLGWNFGGAGENAPINETRLGADPSSLLLAPNESHEVVITGGDEPYRYRVVNSFGRFDPTSMTYTAPARAGTTELQVADSKNRTLRIPIRVAALTKDKPALFAEPASFQLYTGFSQKVTLKGGRPPFTYSLENDLGQFDPDRMIFRAGTNPGETALVITDQDGASTRVPITISELPKPNKTLNLKNLEFVFNTARLTPPSQRGLANNLDELSGVAIEKIIVIGHTDNVGAADYNLQLSRDRAETVKQELMRVLNLRASQVDAIGYGKERPIATNDTPRGQAINRRVELKVYFRK